MIPFSYKKTYSFTLALSKGYFLLVIPFFIIFILKVPSLGKVGATSCVSPYMIFIIILKLFRTLGTIFDAVCFTPGLIVDTFSGTPERKYAARYYQGPTDNSI